MKYCKNCGSPVEEGDAFCGYCGSKLAGDDAQKQEVKNEFTDEHSSDVGHTDRANGEFRTDEDFAQSVDRQFSANEEKEFDFVDERRGTTTTVISNQNDNRKRLKHNQLAESANTYGILALIFGILGGILGIVFGIIGLCKASKAKQLCDTGEYDGGPKVSNARILSIIGIVVAAIWIITLIF